MKNVVKTNKAPGAIGPYSQGINVGDLYFFSTNPIKSRN